MAHSYSVERNGKCQCHSYARSHSFSGRYPNANDWEHSNADGYTNSDASQNRRRWCGSGFTHSNSNPIPFFQLYSPTGACDNQLFWPAI